MLEEGRIKDYKDLLKKAFPKALENDTDAVLDIIPFDENEIKAFDILGSTTMWENAYLT